MGPSVDSWNDKMDRRKLNPIPMIMLTTHMSSAQRAILFSASKPVSNSRLTSSTSGCLLGLRRPHPWISCPSEKPT